MSNITNILGGKYLQLTDNSKSTCLLQNSQENEFTSLKLFNYSYKLNYNDLYHSTILIDFGLDWISEYKDNLGQKLDNSQNSQNNFNKVIKLNDNKFAVFFFSGFIDQNSSNSKEYLNLNDKQSLVQLIDILKNLKSQFNNKDAIIFVKGIENLELFFDKEDLALFFSELINLEYNDQIRQVIIKINDSLVSVDLLESLMILTNSIIQVQSDLLLKENPQKTAKFSIIQLTQKKQTGYSFQQLYKVNYDDLVNKGQLQIQKITNVNDLKQSYKEKMEQRDIHKELDFGFNVLNQANNNISKKDLNPHFERMKEEMNWNNFQEELYDEKKFKEKLKREKQEDDDEDIDDGMEVYDEIE
ncbi:hypothetical protein PPERSA_02334 [Pseudocohnilembus persalinus]|uniref:Uncharacterized protein n=1 Tax=Pseudocohnilembus persalinus TaxID=266149 RepID=A0A0V0QUT3_PSEPJ|nr:hypothetical protein PPERSA_02334 [Pseudocohnilembus persalinus]|eukprot:KRX05802.1 hypothetical protein PPERSA_02334 [Pseudocohnilembus persalinus]